MVAAINTIINAETKFKKDGIQKIGI